MPTDAPKRAVSANNFKFILQLPGTPEDLPAAGCASV
jgi:hypothetical protein